MIPGVEIGLLVVMVAILVCQWRMLHQLGERLHHRQVVSDTQAKLIRREAERVRRDTEQLREDSRLVNERVNRMLSDPGLRRVLTEDL